MLRAAILLLALFAAVQPTAAWTERVSPNIPQSGADGGKVVRFYERIAYARANRITKELEISCKSACPLYLSLMQDGLICAAPGTIFEFHRLVWWENIKRNANDVIIDATYAGPVTDEKIRRQFWFTLPIHVRRMVLAKSDEAGLPRHGNEVKLTAEEIGVPAC